VTTRAYTAEECDIRIQEFQEVVDGCDEAIDLIDRLLELTYSADDAGAAREAMLRLRGDAERARLVWAERRSRL
jgi:hypothetical protein